MRLMVVGEGRAVFFMARSFLARGHRVTVVSRSAEECTILARRSQALIVHGDASDPAVLEDAGAADVDAVLAVAQDDPYNLAVAQLARVYAGVRRTIAVVSDPDNEEVFERLGVDATVSMSRVLSMLVEERAGFAEIRSLLSMAHDQVRVTEIALTGDQPVIGRELRALDLDERCLIACVLRGDDVIIPRGTTTLMWGDRLLVVTRSEDHEALLGTLTGELA